MSKQNPTPRPWAAEEFFRPLEGELANVVSITYQRPDGGCRYVADLLPTWGGDGPPPAEVAANAALIVRAVNYHGALVLTVRNLVARLAAVVPGGCTRDEERLMALFDALPVTDQELVDAARSVLRDLEREGAES